MKFVIIILVTLPCLTWEVVTATTTPITKSVSSTTTVTSPTVSTSSATTPKATTVVPETSPIASTNSVAVTTFSNTVLSSETTSSISVSGETSPTTPSTPSATTETTATPALQCFDINCTGDTCISDQSILPTVKICNAVSGGACSLSRENGVYIASCVTKHCEWSSVVTQTGKRMVSNCCTASKCNKNLTLLENSGSVVYLSAVLMIGLQVFTYVF